jgi:hypothetical protein
MKRIIALGQLVITYLALTVLILDPRNPRRHSPGQIRQIARSIEAFGFVVPILIDRFNRIVAGHGRYLGAQLLGLQEVPVIRLEHLTEAQIKAFRVADNRLTESSTWDDQLLAETLKELSQMEIDFSLEATGFSIGEIDLRIEGLSSPSQGGSDPADRLPQAAGHDPITRCGDLWHLGRHWLLCANALDPASYRSLMRGERARAVISDPPYNVPIRGHASGLGRIQHRDFAMAVGEMDRGEFTSSFLARSFALMAKHSVDGSLHYQFMDWRHCGEILEAGSLAYTELKAICAWVKDCPGMGSLYRSQHEFVFVFKSGTAPHQNNVQLGKFGRNRTTVWQYPCANTFSRQSEEGNLAALHPTIKPVRLVADAILDCSGRGDLILDPFLGSGTTLLAAERVGRICYGMEIDPIYVDVAIRRWQAHSGDKAIHAITGQPFDEVASTMEAHHG